jgi:hypothetical protein
MLETLQRQASIATFGTDFIENVISYNQLPPACPWLSAILFGDYNVFVNGTSEPGQINPLTVLIGQFIFMPQVTVDQMTTSFDAYYEWPIAQTHVASQETARARAEWYWGGEIPLKPFPELDTRPDPNNSEYTITYLRILENGPYTVLFYYWDGKLYNIIYPVSTPNINTVHFYTNASNLQRILVDENAYRIISVW